MHFHLNTNLRRLVAITAAAILIFAPVVSHRTGTVRAFMPHGTASYLAGASSSHTHESITDRVVEQMIRQMFSIPPTTIFLPDKQRHAQLDISTANANADENSATRSLSAYHFDGENFSGSQRRLIDAKVKVRNALARNKVDDARWHLGQALHTLQDFYSHSNWVELKKTDPWEVLGVPGNRIQSPLRSTRTCRDCVRNNCADCYDPSRVPPLTNLITTALTTGYYYGDDISPRSKPRFKCSHGGKVNFLGLVFRDKTGKGELHDGINKDTENCEISPHHQDHREAARIAHLATRKYLDELRLLVGEAKMRLLFGGSPTMAFAVDTTGSMFDEIERVRQQILQIVFFRLSINLPTRYILMPFNDPGVGPFTITDDPNAFIDAVNALSAGGGGDCPELAHTAMYQTLDAMGEGGSLLMFTDADAKDSSFASAVTGFAARNNVSIYNIYSGGDGCGDGLGYVSTAVETGGQFFGIGSSETGVIAQLADFLALPNTIHMFSAAGSLPGFAQTFTVPIDSTLSRATFSVSGTGAANVLVRRPNGTEVDVTDPSVNYISLSTGVILSVDNPIAGSWSITIGGTASSAASQGSAGSETVRSQSLASSDSSHNEIKKTRNKSTTSAASGSEALAASLAGEFSVNVTGQSPLNLTDFNFVEAGGRSLHAGLYPIPGAPVAGQVSHVVTNVSAESTSTPQIELRDLEGTALQTLNLQEVPIPPNVEEGPQPEVHPLKQFYGAITVPTTPFRVYLTGLDANGMPYQRLVPGVVKPRTVQLTPTSTEDLYPGQTTVYTLQVKNFGPADTFSLTGIDDQNFIRSINPANIPLATNETREIKVQVRPPADAPPDTLDTFTFTVQSTTDAGRNNQAIVGPVVVNEAPALKLGTITTTPVGGNGDAFIDPGEGGAISVQLTNAGSGVAANTTATLVTTTPGVIITGPESAYPDLTPSGSGVNSPPFVFYLPSNAPCGRLIDFKLIVRTDVDETTQEFVHNFSVQTGLASSSQAIKTYSGPAVTIPDNSPAGVNIPLNVSGLTGVISDLNFRFNGSSCTTAAGATTVGLDHTFVSDLVVSLTSPRGTTVRLISGVGGGGNNFCNTVLNDEGATTLIQSVTAANAPFTGTFIPAEPLAYFDGENPNGTWVLNVADTESLDTGRVRTFSLDITGTEYSCNASSPDTTPPACAATAYNPGPPSSGDITVQDNGIGLAAINVIGEDNVAVNVTALTPGTTAPAVVTGTLIDQNVNGFFEIEAVDVAGNVSSCSRTVAAPPSSSMIVFHRGWEINSMNADGSGQTNLTNNSLLDSYPALSPDGTKIAFHSYRDGSHGIFVMNADGSNVTRITTEQSWVSHPTWSPDGTKIAYRYDVNQDIYVVNVDGTGRTNITPATPYSMELEPAWSPDGTKIAFRSDRVQPYYNYEIFVMSADGSNVTRLTFNAGMDGGPAWSPDGTKIAFHSYRDYRVNIFVMSADGSGQTNIAPNSSVSDYEPYWSPDGTKIVFQSYRNGNDYDIYVMNADGSNQTRLTDDSGPDTDPNWR